MHATRAPSSGRRILQSVISHGSLPRQRLRIGFYAQQSHQSQHRQYARPARDRHAEDSRTTTSQEHKLVFTQNEVPPLAFWKQHVPKLAPADLTPETCFNTASQFCAIATLENSTWKGRLKRDHGIDPYTLHYTALVVVRTSMALSIFMLRTASDLGYAPSTLSLMRIMLNGTEGNASKRQGYLNALAPRLRSLVAAAQNPDALTLQAIMLRKERKGQSDAAALRLFDQAIAAAGRAGKIYVPAAEILSQSDSDATGYGNSTIGTVGRSPRWTWEVDCHLERGSILAEQGRRDEAEAAFRVAALELDTWQGYLELAKLLPEGAQDREEYLVRAALLGQTEPCLMLANAERKRSLEPGVVSRKQHELLAAEWSRLAGTEDA
ncbi:hypothetical protein B0T17DRAFT_534245 [Bombardia bombarda]|uniref:Uncharacterized protein n=1 Tax=Bombardia bombarda TaxID=252184 RepID=A0AA39WUD1_9PEZI|nr:hypothetical protein B0T17DRAFT_534245 [Bombardia bombarda]